MMPAGRSSSDSDSKTTAATPDETGRTDLPPAARRALEEAAARREAAARKQAEPPREIGGRGGREPVRYGDWEINGKAVDF